MEIENFVKVEEFCLCHEIDASVVHALNGLGLIEVCTIESTHYLYREHTGELERMLRLHYELGINMEGIDAIAHLLNKVTSLQEELRLVKNRLRVFEDE